MSSNFEHDHEENEDYGKQFRPDREIYVVKKDGSKELFNVQKVISAVGKSAYRALTKFTKQYHRLFELDGVELDFEDDALELVAKKSLERKTGARGLRAIMEGSLMDLMYKIPSDDTIRKCTITKDVVDGTGEPEIVRGETPAQAKTAGSRRTSRTHKKDKPETA